MLEIHHILFPTDSSSASAAARPIAERLAEIHGARLETFHAVVLHGPDVADEADRPAILDDGDVSAGPRGGGSEGDDRGDGPGVRTIHTEERAISAAPGILARAAGGGADLIVMGTHGRRGLRRLIVGSVTEEVLRSASCPVVTVRPESAGRTESPTFERILVATDFSSTGGMAFEHAAALAATCGARLDALHVIQADNLPEFYYPLLSGLSHELPKLRKASTERLQELLDDDRLTAVPEARARVEIGRPADEIVGLARRSDADLIVIGSHGRSGLGRVLIGSVAREVVRMAECPVLIVHATGKSLLPTGREARARAEMAR